MIVIKVAEMMGKHKLNQRAVSDMTGIRPNTVSMFWHGTLKRLDMEQLDALCKAFNCQPGDLFEWVPDGERQGHKPLVIDSREVAKMVGKGHAHLLRDIQGYIAIISANPILDSLDFFIPGTYLDAKGEAMYNGILTNSKLRALKSEKKKPGYLPADFPVIC